MRIYMRRYLVVLNYTQLRMYTTSMYNLSQVEHHAVIFFVDATHVLIGPPEFIHLFNSHFSR